MDLLHSMAHFAGRLLRPLRAGESKLAAHRLHVESLARIYVSSPAFTDGGAIPDKYAGDQGRSPPLQFAAPPAETQELVLLCEDPDAPLPRPFVHWIVVGIAPDLEELSEGLPPLQAPLVSGVSQGRNTMGKDGYLGPMPPPGHGPHHYHFQLFALDSRLNVRAPIDRARLLEAMKGHIIGFGELVGVYERQ
jgi:Raf kinase inhibitor-like YbhB/YbcL family protein